MSTMDLTEIQRRLMYLRPKLHPIVLSCRDDVSYFKCNLITEDGEIDPRFDKCDLEDDVRAWIIEYYMERNDATSKWLRLYRRLLITLVRMYHKSHTDGDDENAAAIRNRMRPHMSGMWDYVDKELKSLSPKQDMTRCLLWINAFDVTCKVWWIHDDMHNIAWDMFYKYGIVDYVAVDAGAAAQLHHDVIYSDNMVAFECAYRRYGKTSESFMLAAIGAALVDEP